mmetsp:Transcript_18326/g.29330  ORF Transcript_18326/g.29330 Transcript_18326/m.29330 type:complete len:225 (+) Transcript_18326:2616-3290(+)
MDGQVVGFGHRCQGPQLVQRIDAAPFGRLGDGHRPPLRAMHTTDLLAQDRGTQGTGRHPVAARNQGQFGTARVELRRIALVLVNMGHGRTKHRLPGLSVAGERQSVGRRASGHQINGSLGCFKTGADCLTDFIHDRVGTIRHRIAIICGHDPIHDQRVHRAGVVRGKEHQVGSSMMKSSQSSSATSNSLTVWPRSETPALCTLSGVPEISGCQSGRGCPVCSSR